MSRPFPSYPDTILETILPEEGVIVDDPIEQLRTMDQIAEHAGEVGLSNLRAGVLGYKVVTRNVYQAMQDGRFEHPEKFEIAIPEFANLFYDSVHRHIQGRRDEVSPNWQRPMYSAHSRHASPGVQMWHFWRGHIPDLTKVLLLTGTEEKHHQDYDDIDIILEESIPQVMAEISVANNAISRYGVHMVMNDAYRLRDDQWWEFRRLQAMGWDANNAREATLPGVYRHDMARSAVQIVGDLTMRLVAGRQPLDEQVA